MVRRKFISNKEADFFHREVYSTKSLSKQLSPTGYEAFRISPRKTKKFGKPYKRIYGATVAPDYSRGVQGKYGAKVEWFPHGFTLPSVKSGTRLLQPLKDYPVNQEEARSKLMLKRRRRK